MQVPAKNDRIQGSEMMVLPTYVLMNSLFSLFRTFRDSNKQCKLL